MADNENRMDDMDFAFPAEENRSPDDIRLDVLKALAGTEQINAAAISIEVENGLVRLVGQVDDQHLKDLAEGITRNVPGVHGVENNLITLERTPLNQLPSLNANRPAEQ